MLAHPRPDHGEKIEVVLPTLKRSATLRHLFRGHGL
jgi:hypothetical protein